MPDYGAIEGYLKWSLRGAIVVHAGELDDDDRHGVELRKGESRGAAAEIGLLPEEYGGA